MDPVTGLLRGGIAAPYPAEDTSPVLGRKVTTAVEELDIFPTPPGCTNVILRCTEVTSLCPVTGQPDFYEILIQYTPTQFCIESKSLKLYLLGFRNKGQFCEALAGIISNRIFEDAKPSWVRVEVHQTSRGGIEITGVSSKTIGQWVAEQNNVGD